MLTQLSNGDWVDLTRVIHVLVAEATTVQVEPPVDLPDRVIIHFSNGLTSYCKFSTLSAAWEYRDRLALAVNRAKEEA